MCSANSSACLRKSSAGTVTITARAARPFEQRGLALIAADGLWSSLRERIGDRQPPRFPRHTAWRALVPADAVMPDQRAPAIDLWLGSNAHLVHYPVRSGALINIVAIIRDDWREPGWSAPGARADILAACGMTVLVSDYFQYYRLAAYLTWRTRERIGIVLGVPSIYELFDEKYYTDLPGGILENFGRLLKNDLKIYVYPLQRSPTDELQTTRNVNLKSDLQLLYDYLCRRGSLVQLDNYNPKYLPIFSRDVLKRIATGDESWDQMVPPQVAEIIRRRGFFAYRKP